MDVVQRQAEKTRRRAERDAEQTRLEAVASANRVFEQIAALERPMADLEATLRVESDRLQEELEDHVGGETVASVNRVLEEITALERPVADLLRKLRLESSRVQRQLSHQADDEPGATPTQAESPQEEAAPETTEPREPQYQEPTASPAPVTAPETESDAPKGKLFSRLRPAASKRPFIERPGHCGVCQRTFEAGSEHALRQSGWRVNDDVGLCPEDQAKGWQLPEGARTPFRRRGD